ncbi:MAG: hypothetical protein ACTIND_06480, partial [Glutamicibacter arilaitensis]
FSFSTRGSVLFGFTGLKFFFDQHTPAPPPPLGGGLSDWVLPAGPLGVIRDTAVENFHLLNRRGQRAFILIRTG